MSDIRTHDDQSSILPPPPPRPPTSTTPLLRGGSGGTSHHGYSGVPITPSPLREDLDTEALEGDDSDDDGRAEDDATHIEIVSSTWPKGALVVAYMSIFLMAFTTSLEGQVTYALSAFATSSFHNHSLLSTVYVVQGVINAVIKPPMAKVADVFGRLEAFAISVFLCVLGYILMASSQNIEAYASAQIFYSAGATGLHILQQVFIADTSSFFNRALFSSLPDSPFLATVWIGPAIADAFVKKSSWRWGYGIWAFILPVAFLPLGLSLFFNGRKSQKRSFLTMTKGSSKTSPSFSSLLHDLDVVGTLLLSGGLALILIPLTLVSHSPSGWSDLRIHAMILIGTFSLILFPIWESQPSLAPRPLLPLFLLRSRTFVAGCSLGFFYFMIFYIAVQPYFYSYLLVALNLPVSRAGQITQTFSFASTISAIAVSVGIRQMKTSPPQLRLFIIAGAGLYFVAITILVYTRTRDASVMGLFVAQGALGAGAGLMHIVTQLMVQASATGISDILGGKGGQQGYVGVATAAFLTVVEVGGAVGAALSGAVWGRVLPIKLEMYLPEELKSRAGEIFSSVEVARNFTWGSPEREAIGLAYQETITVLLWIALGLCIPLLGVAGLLPGSGSGRGYAGLGEVEVGEVDGGARGIKDEGEEVVAVIVVVEDEVGEEDEVEGENPGRRRRSRGNGGPGDRRDER